MKTCIICNSGAGNVNDIEAIRAQLETFPGAQVQFTKDAGEATKHARESVAGGCDLVIAAGGDGTLNEVINGVVPYHDRVAVGLIPLGTGNDFARTLGLPAGIPEAIEILRQGNARPTDLARLTNGNERYFLNVSAGGFSGAGQ